MPGKKKYDDGKWNYSSFRIVDIKKEYIETKTTNGAAAMSVLLCFQGFWGIIGTESVMTYRFFREERSRRVWTEKKERSSPLGWRISRR
ncbi:MAG: hypothetical protein ACI4LJ_02465, partial [Anaerovoracaceae bacterium]